LAASIRDALDLEAELIEGSGGVFEVELDGDLIFSKKRTGRFPAEGEVEGAIESRRAS
jgi:selenoprotein W-related protein